MKSNYFKFFTSLLFFTFIYSFGLAQNLQPKDITKFKGYELSQEKGIIAKLNGSRGAEITGNLDEKPSNSILEVLERYGEGICSKIQLKNSDYEFLGHTYKGMYLPYASTNDSFGNTFITGAASNPNTPEGNLYTIMLDPNGQQLWESRAPGTKYAGEFGTVITMDYLGVTGSNPVVAGVHWNGNDMDIKVIKYDSSDGSIVWQHIFDGNSGGMDVPTAIATGVNGDILVSGISYTGISFAYVTLKYDVNGNLLWSVIDDNLNPATWEEPLSIVEDTQGNVLVTGFGVNSNYFRTYYTIKYSSTGNLLWKNSYTFERLEDESDPTSQMIETHSIAKSIAVDTNGNSYVTGTFDVFLPGSQFPKNRIGTIKYDVNGVEQWVQIYESGGALSDKQTNGDKVQISPTNTIYVSGIYSDYSFPADFGLSLISYDTNGNENWVQEKDGFYNIAPSQLQLDSNGYPVIAGFGNDAIFTTDQKVSVMRYDLNGQILDEATYTKAYLPTESFENLIGLGIVNNDAYLNFGSHYTSEGRVFESIKMAMNSGINNETWITITGNPDSSTNSDLFHAISDSQNNTYVTGTFISIENNQTVSNFFISKYNAQGVVEWQKLFGPQFNNQSNGIMARVNNADELIVFLLPDTFLEFPLVIQKYNSNGDLLWETTKVTQDALLTTYLIDTDDNIYVGGSARENSTATFTTFNVMKFSTNGQELWDIFIPAEDTSHNFNQILGGSLNNNDELIFAGARGVSSFFNEDLDIFTLKLTKNGNLIWYSSLDLAVGNSNVYRGLLLNDNNDIYVSGSMMNSNGELETIIVKFDDDGDEKWVETYGEAASHILTYGINATSTGELIVPVGKFNFSDGHYFVKLLKYDSLGVNTGVLNLSSDRRSFKDLYIDGDDEINILTQAEDFTPYPYRPLVGLDFTIGTLFKTDATGSFIDEELLVGPELSLFLPKSLVPLANNTLLLGGKLFHESFFFNGVYFFETTHVPLNIEDFDMRDDSVGNFLGQNYPNPTLGSTKIPFYLQTNSSVRIILYDNQGRFIKEIVNAPFSKGVNTIQTDLSGLNRGIYFYQIESGNFKQARKLVIK